MADNEIPLAAAALAIALVALLTAFGQLLGQYFSTADGYRRCKKSVMGHYAARTRRVWKWKEFRFETLYTVPEIFMSGDGAPNLGSQVILTGSDVSRKLSLMPVTQAQKTKTESPKHLWTNRNPGTELSEKRLAEYQMAGVETMKVFSSSFTHTSGELACWIPLLHWIHETTQISLNDDHKKFIAKLGSGAGVAAPHTRVPAIVLKQKSWDFQPPDVAKPLAKTTLSDIAVIARRMGMKWKDFRPSEGILRAEGHSHILTSTLVRGLGLVLQYSYTGREDRLRDANYNLSRSRVACLGLSEYPEVYIPSAASDRLGCGVVRSIRKFGLPDFTLSTSAQIIAALNVLDRSGTSAAALNKILKEEPDYKFRVGDIVAFSVHDLRLSGSNLVQIPAPSDNVNGVTVSVFGRNAFRLCLEEHIVVHQRNVGPLTKEALEICRDIGREFAAWDFLDENSNNEEPWVITRDCRYLDKLQGILQQTTELLSTMETDYPGFRYHNLLGAHIKECIFAEGGETSMQRSFTPDYRADVDAYFRKLPAIVERMAQTGVNDPQFVVDAWVTMMMRGFCWGAMHFFVPGERVPVEYFGSQLPVFIG